MKTILGDNQYCFSYLGTLYHQILVFIGSKAPKNYECYKGRKKEHLSFWACMRRTITKAQPERGEAELMFFGVALIVCGLISGSLMLLGWVRDTKDTKVRNREIARLMGSTPAPVTVQKDPAEYFVQCKKAPWAVFDNKVKCEVMKESYGELYLIPGN
jgi:hypothetical protein